MRGSHTQYLLLERFKCIVSEIESDTHLIDKLFKGLILFTARPAWALVNLGELLFVKKLFLWSFYLKYYFNPFFG